jgi:hypothetical protein
LYSIEYRPFDSLLQVSIAFSNAPPGSLKA